MANSTSAAATRRLVLPRSLLLHAATGHHAKNESDTTNTPTLSQGSETAVATPQSCLILFQKPGVSSFEQTRHHSDEDTTLVGRSS
jgi:hypothetical protein